MKPIVANPKTTFDDLIDGIDTLGTDEARRGSGIGAVFAAAVCFKQTNDKLGSCT